MIVRRAEEKDCRVLAEIDALSNAGAWSETSFAAAVRNPYSILLLAEDTEPIGFLAAEIQGDIFAIDEIAVHPDSRRKGAARAMLSEGERIAAGHGCVNASLEVRSRNDGAIAFYIENKFNNVGIRKRLYRDPDDDGIVMMKAIGAENL